MTLPEGRWEVSIETLEPSGRVPAVVSRRVRSRFEGLVVVVSAVDGYARLRVTTDGELAETLRLEPGQRRVYRADDEVTVRTGNGKATVVTQNGRRLGPMGDGARMALWRFERGKPPTPLE